jgi:uncharacterized SAM-binding protein YcdF (DUF218 family)
LTDYHIYRAELLAKYAGISAKHIGADTDLFTVPSNYLREMLAVMKTWLFPPDKVVPGKI